MSQSVPEAVLEQWRPINWSQSDLRTLEPLLPTIRGWIEQAKPGTAAKTRRFLLAASGMAVWAYRSFGNIDPDGGVPPLQRRTMGHRGLRG